MSAKFERIVKSLSNTIKAANKKKTSPYDTTATVKRVEGKTAYVHIPGGVDETPVEMTINAAPGDSVQVRVGGGKAWLVGNGSAPPTDDTRANQSYVKATEADEKAIIAGNAAESAQQSAEIAHTAAVNAQNSANEAKASAYNANEYSTRALASLSTVQSVAETLTWITQHGTMTLTTDTEVNPTHVYFVVDATGDYVVGNTHYSLVIEPKDSELSTYYELSIDESLNNYVGTHLAVTGEGLWLLPAGQNSYKVLIATGAGTTYTTAGTYIINDTGGQVASFRADGVTIGELLSGKTRVELTSGGMRVVRNDDGTDVEIANIGYGTGNGESSPTNAPYYTFGIRGTTTIAYSSSKTYHIGDLCRHNNNIYVCITEIETPEAWNDNHWEYYCGNYSVVAGGPITRDGAKVGNIASGYGSFAEGTGTFAGSLGAHAEGIGTISMGPGSHAEGDGPIQALSAGSHAEGYAPDNNDRTGNGIIASLFGSHAEGYSRDTATIIASASGSHAEGFAANTYKLIASGEGSHAEGFAANHNIEASGTASHAENVGTIASGGGSHAEGYRTVAESNYSHASGVGTHTSAIGQTVVGRYNSDDSDALFIVGNGSENARSNAFAVLASGLITGASNALIYRGEATGDANNITTTGIYYIGGTPLTNGENVKWRHLVVINGGVISQLILNIGANSAILCRVYSGNPASWSPWYSIT